MTAALPPGFFARAVAHRGLHDRAAGRIENSASAVAAAARAGWAVEIDVQLSADGRAVVFHDDRLDRLTAETGRVRDRTASELGRLALTDGRGDAIAALEAVAALVAGRVPLVVEVKDQGGALSEAGVGPLEAAVAAALAGYAGPVAVMSFNPASMAAMARLAPALPRGLVACAADAYDEPLSPARRAALASLADFDAAGACFASYGWRDLPTPATARLRGAGAPVICWTVRSAADAAAALRHADAITFEGFDPDSGAAADPAGKGCGSGG
jgi:glycerophosphoryl diester phosphodiesterase